MTDFRFGNERIAGVAARHPVVKFGPPPPHRHHWLIRPEDLLVFDVGWVNLTLAPGKPAEGDADAEPARLHRAQPGDAFLIVTLPPQHITEIAYFTTAPELQPNDPSSDEPLDDPPIKAIIAGWSRLAFKVTDDVLPIDWTSASVLAAVRQLELNVAANALPPRSPLREFRPGIEVATGPLLVASEALIPAAAGPAGGTAAESFGGPLTRGPTTVRSFARARRNLRNSIYRVGLVDGLETAIAGTTVDDAIEGGFSLPEALLRPKPGLPGSNETAIELPWRLLLSPSRDGAFFHWTTPVEGETGRTELWHTRLGSAQNGDIAKVDPKRILRAIWALSPPGWKQVTTPTDAADLSYMPEDVDDDPFRASLNEYERHSVVHLSSNYRLKQVPPSKGWFEPDPLDVDHMALSSLGGWLDSRGAWEGGEQPNGISVEEWRHRATLGRDHFVRVVKTGRLFPLGHRASLVKITERRFEPSRPGNPAYLRQRMFIIVREPLRTYRASGWTWQDADDPDRMGERWDLKLPFTAMRITTRVSPLIDEPTGHAINASEPMRAFWPYVKGKPFCFGVVATDVDGKPVDLSMPLIFVGQQETDELWTNSMVPDDIAAAYRTDSWPSPGTQLLATVPVGGQLVAYAQSDAPDDTSVATRSITFDAEVPVQGLYDKLPQRQPRFLPVMRSAQLDVPALQKIAGTNAAAALRYDTTYLHNGFGGANGGQVFLARDEASTLPALGVPFSQQSQRSGGLVAPDLSLSGLSRLSGPVSGDIDLAAAGTMDPGAWFADVLDGAKLFGVLSLADIVKSVGFDELDKLPRLAGGAMDQVQKVVADMERLHTLLAGIPGPHFSGLAFLLDQLVNPTSGSIAALLKGGDSGPVVSQLQLVQGSLAGVPAAITAAGIGAGPAAVLTDAAASLESAITTVLNAAELLDQFANGELPDELSARFEWRPELQPWPSGNPIFVPKGAAPYRNLTLSVEASGTDLTVTCSLDRFDIDLEVLVLKFEQVQFRSRAGKKPEIDVKFETFVFAGPLAFIETLRQVIPLDGFSDPPEVSVTTEGISAGFSMGLPNLSFGVFSLENLSLAAGFTVPFVGPPMSTWFRFCERENPSRLTVMMFGGGFFFGVTVDAKGLQVAEGAIEFGAAISVDFGVASGSVSAMAGLYFKIESDNLTLAGYFRLRGEVEALGIVSVTIELYLEMKYETASGKCVGTATIKIDIDVTLFSTTISITCSKKFAGSGPDPTLADMFDVNPATATSTDWDLYCGAFA